MTREEAITVFKAFMDNPLFSDIHKAAFSIAIHDIKQRHDWDINKLMLVPKTEWEQEPQTFKWCTDCREYDQEKHCCHRWSKVIRDTVEEMKQEQEPRWIPVSERLPNSDDEVLCWYEYYHWSQEKVLPEYGLGRYFKETKAWFGEVANGKDVRVIAWMPLPKPYEPQESEEV